MTAKASGCRAQGRTGGEDPFGPAMSQAQILSWDSLTSPHPFVHSRPTPMRVAEVSEVLAGCVLFTSCRLNFHTASTCWSLIEVFAYIVRARSAPAAKCSI